MTVFAVILPTPQAAVVEKLKQEFANEFLEISSTSWLVSGQGTTEEIIRRLGVFDRSNPTASLGNAIAIPVTTYFGRASPAIWEFLKTKIEALPGG